MTDKKIVTLDTPALLAVLRDSENKEVRYDAADEMAGRITSWSVNAMRLESEVMALKKKLHPLAATACNGDYD